MKKFVVLLITIILVTYCSVNISADTITKEEFNDFKNEIQEQLNSMYDILSETQAPSESTQSPGGSPKIKLISPVSAAMKNNASLDIELVVKNIGSSFASNLLTQVTSGVDSEAPFTLQFLDATNSVSTLYEGLSQKMILRVKTDKDAKSGTYAVNLTHLYRVENGPNATDTETFVIKVENEAGSVSIPKIILSDFSISKQNIKPGDDFSLSAILQNSSSSTAYSVQLNAEGFKSTELYITDSVNSVYAGEMTANKKQNINYNLKASSKITSGSYPIQFSIKYRDSENKDYTESFSYYINVLSKDSGDSDNKGQIKITSLTSPSGVYDVGQVFSIDMDITNSGTDTVQNVKISAGAEGDAVIVPRSPSVQSFPNFAVGETQKLSFLFSPTSRVVTQNYAIRFQISYETGNETSSEDFGTVKETFSFEQYAGVDIVNSKADKEAKPTEAPEGNNTSAPKIIIQSYESDPVLVKAGQEFDLHVVFLNTHKVKTVSNIKANLVAVDNTEKKGSVFTPVNGSNTLFFDDIPPKGTVEKTLRMYAVPDALPRTYTIQVKFSYEDEDFNKFEDSDEIGINVKQVVDLMTSEISVPTNVMAGQPVYVNFSLSNTGKTTLTNLQATINGDFDTSGSLVYFGTLQQSGTTYYEGMFTVYEPGQHTGEVVITFEDDTGEQFERKQDFTVDVSEMINELPPEFDKPIEPEQQGFIAKVLALIKKTWFWVVVFLGIALITAAAIFVRKKAIKRQQRVDDDE